MSIGVCLVTHCAKKHLPHCLPPYLNSPLKPKVLLINSSSHDGTVELAKEMGAETLVIPRAEFNHGLTRELGRKALNTDIVVMTTPDAYAGNERMLEALVRPLQEGEADVAYANQIPHKGADFFETFARDFNYPAHSHIRSLDDLEKYGVYTFFCSDSCAAYLNKSLDEIGGFSEVLLGEDTVAVAKILRGGGRVAYVSEALVHHSHRYTLKQEFQRCFDTGLARRGYASLLRCGESDSKRGISYTVSMLKKLSKEKPFLLPYGFLQTGVKWCGYQIGKRSLRLPVWMKKKLSSQDFYWH